MQENDPYYNADDLQHELGKSIDYKSKFVYSTGLLYAAEVLLKQASIYLEDKELLDDIDAHLERVERFYNDTIAEYKTIITDVQEDN